MPSWKTLFKNDHYIAAVELVEGQKKPTLTIDRIVVQKMEQDDGQKKEKPVIYFKEIKRGWVFGKTVGLCLAALFGEDYTKWVGKRVTLHSERVAFGSDQVDGIRVVGSPDISKAMRVKIKLPKRRAFTVELIVTQAKGGHEMRDPEPSPSEQSEQAELQTARQEA